MINQALINATVAGWNIIFASNKSEAELEFFSRKLKQHFDDTYTDEGFKLAAILVEKKTRFFPTIADLCEVEDEVHDKLHKRTATKRIEYNNDLPEITDEEAKRNLKRLDIIVGQVTGKYTEQQAMLEMAKLNTDKESK